MNLLYLVHRLPYPPNKGDKVRSYNLLKHLAGEHQIFLGTFVDDPQDRKYTSTAQSFCADSCIQEIHPKVQTLKSAVAMATGEPLGLRFYKNRKLQSWVNDLLDAGRIDAIVVFSSVMAQFVARRDQAKLPPIFVDFVDVDSYKWTQFAQERRWPLSWVYAREGRKLLAYEKSVARLAQASFFATENELALFQKLSPQSGGNLMSMDNGVDAEYFIPAPQLQTPFRPDSTKNCKHLVFTGAMDYWPNIDAVEWFSREIMPALRTLFPSINFHIVGRNPSETVLALAGPDVFVTGTVPDVRPYLQFADVVVAPLRVARGIQNKILEAMARARPVVASRSCVDVLRVTSGMEIMAAHTGAEFVSSIQALLENPSNAGAMGRAGRESILRNYSWVSHLSKLDACLQGLPKK